MKLASVVLFVFRDFTGAGIIQRDGDVETYFTFRLCVHDMEIVRYGMHSQESRCKKCGYTIYADSSG